MVPLSPPLMDSDVFILQGLQPIDHDPNHKGFLFPDSLEPGII
jgi:hypothetical protein